MMEIKLMLQEEYLNITKDIRDKIIKLGQTRNGYKTISCGDQYDFWLILAYNHLTCKYF